MSQKKVLMVEDHTQIRGLVKLLLNQEQLAITEAADGGLAVEALNRETFDLVLLDLMIPVVDGYQILEKIRTEERHATTPVIVLSSRSQDKDIEKGLAMGATHYITKPFVPADLVSTVRTALGLPAKSPIG